MSKKRQLLIDTALALFYKNGVNSIGINEILKVSGVAKRTLYSHFDSKEALVLATLKQRHDIFIEWLEEKLSNTQSDQEVIEQLFTALEGWFSGTDAKLGSFRGCFFINTSAEFSDAKSEVSRYCRLHKEQVRLLIEKKLSGKKPHLLDAICIIKEGAITTAYMTGKGAEVTSKSIQLLNQL